MIVAVTGNTGSGKSTVAKLFEKWGARRIDADEVGRAVWQGDPAVQAKIAGLLGDAVRGRDGTLDRAKLGNVVFSRRESLEAFDTVVQPILKERIARLLADARAGGGRWVLDAALLFEWGYRDRVDRVVAVIGAAEIRAKRVAERHGISMGAARERVRAQNDEGEKARAADYVIRNEGTLEELEDESRRVWETLLFEKGESK